VNRGRGSGEFGWRVLESDLREGSEDAGGLSGRTMERRDQVLIGRRSFFSAAACTFFAR
jgi:hypothetical protein